MCSVTRTRASRTEEQSLCRQGKKEIEVGGPGAFKFWMMKCEHTVIHCVAHAQHVLSVTRLYEFPYGPHLSIEEQTRGPYREASAGVKQGLSPAAVRTHYSGLDVS